MSKQTIRAILARAFEDNLLEAGRERYIVYCSQGFLALSTLLVFLSTFDSITHRYEETFYILDWVITLFFTVEVMLRIWTAGDLHPDYRGWKGRVRYCFSFYGLIDIISTYSFYLTFFVQVSFTYLRILRVVRVIRIFRYIPAFSILRRAVSAKSRELLVSIQFLCIVTVLLSFILYFVEHQAQPDVYDNGLSSTLWAFAKYLGDPVSFIEMPPVTVAGKSIAFILGILGVAIFAVPAGLIGSSFTEIIEEDRVAAEHARLCKELYNAFQRQMDRPAKFQIVPRFMLFNEIQARLSLTSDEITVATRQSEDFRLISLSSMIPVGSPLGRDALAVELCYRNTSYGCCIDRGSKITIVNPSSVVDPVIGHFAYYLALIGGFNYISRETGTKRPYKSFYLFSAEDYEFGLPEYMSDLRHLTSREGSFCWTILACSGALDVDHPTQFHFSTGHEKGDQSFEGEGFLVHDMECFHHFYEDFTKELETYYGFKSDHNLYYTIKSPRLYAHKLPAEVSVLGLRIAWAVTAWSTQNIAIAKLLADYINRYFCGIEAPIYPATLSEKSIGFDAE